MHVCGEPVNMFGEATPSSDAILRFPLEKPTAPGCAIIVRISYSSAKTYSATGVAP
jgi:hypothetical protein